MQQQFKKINFENRNTGEAHFDFVNFEDVLKKIPADHSQFEFHKVSFYAILLLTQGEGIYNLNFKDYAIKKGTLFTLRKDNIHKFYKSKAKGVLLLFTENFIVNYSNELEASKTFLLFNEMLSSPKIQLPEADFDEIMVLITLIKEEFFKARDEHSSTILRNLVQIITAKLFRIKSKENALLHNNKYLSLFLNFQELVEKDCFNNKKVSFYAKEMGITSKTLNKVTKSIIQKSAKSIINDVVIIQSKRLIINSQDSLTEIAYQVGFDEPTNFFKYFRKNTGFSPSQFREKHLRG